MTNVERNLVKQICLQLYRSQRYSSEKRNHVQPLYTSEELLQWLYKQENLPDILKNYIKSNFKSKFKPSIDRLKNDEPYHIENIQLLTWGEHVNLPNSNRSKRIIMHKEDEIEIFDSAAQAARIFYMSASHISTACKLGKKAYGYNWSYYD